MPLIGLWLALAALPPDTPPSSAWLNLLPDGPEKRAFILDCTGCHQFRGRFAWAGDRPRTAAEWRAAIDQMLGFAGASGGFPVIAADRQAIPTAAWLAQYVTRPPSPEGREPAPSEARGGQGVRKSEPEGREPAPSEARGGQGVRTGEATVTEYDMPVGYDLPHDLAVETSGQVVITGMFTHRLWLLDPATGTVTSDSIPLRPANPRAVELARDGARWVALGGPQRVARHDPRTGLYPHSIGLDTAGGAWFNGHFTRDPELIGRVDPATGAVKTWTVPKHPSVAGAWGPLPYELRVGPDGRVWLSELIGNRIVGFDPATERFTTHDLPTPVSGPRRFDIDARGTLWIPAFASGRLVRFEPAAGRFTEYDLPVRDAAPYVARVDGRTGLVWIGTGAADAVFSFDPRTERFVTYPLPSRGALVRHLVVDSGRNAIWLAYGASPGELPARVARLEPR
jgi:virginiamycin B lyase